MNKKIIIFIIIIFFLFLLIPPFVEADCHYVCSTYCDLVTACQRFLAIGLGAGYTHSSCVIGSDKWCSGLMPTYVTECTDEGVRRCRGDACPNYSGWNGWGCKVTKDCWSGISCYGQDCSGKWDASNKWCVGCSGKLKVKRFGSSGGIDVTCGNCDGYDITDTCESACGAPSVCDEKAPGTNVQSCGNCGHKDCLADCTLSACLDDKKANGTACSAGTQCCSGNCVDGVCCNSACNGTCKKCNLTGLIGTCSNISDNQDPDNECSASWNSCDSTCVRKGADGYCDGAGACDTNDQTENISSGYVCTGSGSKTAVSSSNYCNYDEDCDDGDCSATKWWTSCNGSGSCRSASDHIDAATSTVTATASKVLKNDCSEASPSSSLYCAYAEDCDDGDCSATKYYRSCNGTGSCRTDNTDASTSAVTATTDKVLKNNCSEASPSSSLYCGYDEDCDNGDCSATKYYRGCASGGSCRTDNTNAATSTVTATASKVLKNDCSEASPSSSLYCAYTEDCDDGDCSATKYYRSCNGTGSCRTDNTGASTATVTASASKVLKNNCSEASPSSSLFCAYTEDCDDGDCSATKYYRSCNGTGSCRTDNTGAHNVSVYADTGYTLTSNCGTTGTTYCLTNQCRDGDSWHHKCDKRCDASHNCDYWIDASCVDHCTNGIQDCDETGIDSGGSCACNLNRTGDYTINFECILEGEHHLISGNLTITTGGYIQMNANSTLFFDSGYEIRIEGTGYILKSASNTIIQKQ